MPAVSGAQSPAGPIDAAASGSGGTGLLVLGMHRSGTSAVAGLLGIGGADLGARVLGASDGNETGHWEDAVAVDLHEELLARFGTGWSDPFGLPDDWIASAAAQDARARIRDYIHGDRAHHRPWAAKDPRLCLFGGLWRDAAESVPAGVSAILVLRSPAEVVASLQLRDDMGKRHAQLLWLDYMQSAARIVAGMPHAVVDYEALLRDWKAALSGVRALPAGAGLHYAAAQEREVAQFLDPARRHHRIVAGDSGDPVVDDAWRLLSSCAGKGTVEKSVADALTEHTRRVRGIVRPVLEESRLRVRRLWERTARAEAMLAGGVAGAALGLQVGEMRQLIERQHADVVSLYSHDIRRMQDASAQALAGAEAAQRALDDARAETLEPVQARIAAVEQRLLDVYSDDIRRMQDVSAQALAGAEAAQRALEDARAETLEPVQARIAAVEQRLLDVYSDDIRRMQDAVARAMVHEEAANAAAAQARMAEQHLRQERDAGSEALEETSASLRAAEAQLERQRREREDLALRLDQRQRENAALAHEIGVLRPKAQRLEEVLKSKSWTMTRPLRVMRRALTGHWSEADSAEWKASLRQLAGRAPLLPAGARARMVAATLPQGVVRPGALPDAGTADALQLAPGDGRLPDVFVWSVIDWHFRTQRPQHLARALADKGHRVFYVSNNFADAAEPGFRVDPLDREGRLFQIHLNLEGSPGIYFDLPSPIQAGSLRESLARLLEWTATSGSISLVQHPYWTSLVRAVPNARVVYDCMDHHAGFSDNASAILEAERRLLAESDLVVVTSAWLEEEVKPQARATALVRNAGEFGFFRHAPAETFRDPQGRRVLGYYGAIAEWFDPELVRAVATAYPDALVVLVGSDTSRAGEALADLANVRMIGEVPYAELPYWLHGFDVCLLPFKVVPLTMATNPVKVYEYLAAGKPVVSVDLPEMAQFDALARTARDHKGFVSAVGDALAERDDGIVARRKAFAAGQTWAHRAEALDQAIAAIREPKVSIVVLTYNNLVFTRACLSSIEAYSDYANLEVIVVDNASTDGSPEWLRAWEREPSPAGHARRLILNDRNAGFSAGNNIGLNAATGDYLIVLNNDTYVTPGWVRTLCAHFRRDDSLGLVGPVTNNIGNEARIDIAYDDMDQMIARASAYTRAHPGESLAVRNAAFFCVAMPRATYERVGGLDEAFGIGFFEDDDYCRRVEQAGLGIACAEDVFVHHHLSASFDKLKAERKKELFDANKAIYEAKWGMWEPHSYRN